MQSSNSNQQLSQSETVLILDFGSQYVQLIARRVRKTGVEEFQAALEAGDADFELIDLAVEEADGAVVGIEVGGGTDHGVHFEEFGGEGGG